MTCKVPTLDTFKSWSRRFQWQTRALLFDAGENHAVADELDHRRCVMQAVETECERRRAVKLEENTANQR